MDKPFLPFIENLRRQEPARAQSGSILDMVNQKLAERGLVGSVDRDPIEEREKLKKVIQYCEYVCGHKQRCDNMEYGGAIETTGYEVAKEAKDKLVRDLGPEITEIIDLVSGVVEGHKSQQLSISK